MNELGEKAIAQTLLAIPALIALVGNRVTWDDEEIDLKHPAITLRTLATRLPASGMNNRGGLRQCLVEISGHAGTSGGASKLCDLIIEAMTPFHGEQTSVTVDGEECRFGGILLNDVQQTPSPQARAYRKSATFSVWLYE